MSALHAATALLYLSEILSSSSSAAPAAPAVVATPPADDKLRVVKDDLLITLVLAFPQILLPLSGPKPYEIVLNGFPFLAPKLFELLCSRAKIKFQLGESHSSMCRTEERGRVGKGRRQGFLQGDSQPFIAHVLPRNVHSGLTKRHIDSKPIISQFPLKF